MANGNDGRDALGRFTVGNQAAKGRPRPFARAVHRWRKVLVKSVTPQDLAEVLCQLLAAAKRGEPWAIREVLQRCLGGADDLAASDSLADVLTDRNQAAKVLAAVVAATLPAARSDENERQTS